MTDFVGDNDHGDTLPPIEILHKEVVELRKQRFELKTQRDDARRKYCDAMSLVSETYVPAMRKTPNQIAKEMNWNCFTENNYDATK